VTPRCRILIVEDEPVAARVLERRLELLGFDTVGPVATGEEAVRKAAETDPELVIMDIQLRGELDGIDAAARMAAAHAIPVIFLTSHADDETLRRAQHVAPYGYLLKPFDDRLLRITIELALFRKATERRLQESQKLKAVAGLAGGIAHEFNNLMSAVIGFSELLLGSLPSEDASRSDIELIASAGRRAAALTRRLLSFARRAPLAPTEVAVDVLLREVRRSCASLHGPRVSIELGAGLPGVTVVLDEPEAMRAFEELITNAVEAMPAGGTVTLTAETRSVGADGAARVGTAPGDYVAIRVLDTGIGMSEPVRARAFEPFFSTKAVGKGAGLGLAAVHGFVKQSGGAVSVESAPGRGTCVTLLIPRRAP